MTKKEILQNNKLIAEFMKFEIYLQNYIIDSIKKEGNYLYKDNKKYKYHIPSKFNAFKLMYDGYMDFTKNSKNIDCFAYYPQHMGFHESWDWLIPVITKISKINYGIMPENKHNFFEHLPNVELETRISDVIFIPLSENINIVYEKVVEFIKWHNKNIKL